MFVCVFVSSVLYYKVCALGATSVLSSPCEPDLGHHDLSVVAHEEHRPNEEGDAPEELLRRRGEREDEETRVGEKRVSSRRD